MRVRGAGPTLAGMGRPQPLAPQALEAALLDLPRWQCVDGCLVRHTTAATFGQAIAWVVQVATVAQALDHHPDIDIRYRTVTWRLRTHDVDPGSEPAATAPAVTDLDITLAHAIDAVVDAIGSIDPALRGGPEQASDP